MGPPRVALPSTSSSELCWPSTPTCSHPSPAAELSWGASPARGLRGRGQGRGEGIPTGGGGKGAGRDVGRIPGAGTEGSSGAGGAGSAGRGRGTAGAERQPRGTTRAGDLSAAAGRRASTSGGGNRVAAHGLPGPGPCRGAGMRAPALLPPALLTCCGWLLAPVSATPAPARPALRAALPGGSAPAPGCAALPSPAAGWAGGAGSGAGLGVPTRPPGSREGAGPPGTLWTLPAEREEASSPPGRVGDGLGGCVCSVASTVPGSLGIRSSFLVDALPSGAGPTASSRRLWPARTVLGPRDARVGWWVGLGHLRRPHVSEGNCS